MCYSKLKWRKFKPSNKFTDFAKGLNTITKLSDYIGKNFKYVADKTGFFGDYWKTPEEMWEDGYGDCDDHAIFCLYILTEVIGIEANMVTCSGYFIDKEGNLKKNGHAVCVFKDGVKWGIFSNNIFSYSGGTIEDIGKKYYPKGLSYMEVIDKNGKTVKVKFPKYLFWGTF